MKILYYYSKLNIGGAERSTVRLLNRFVMHGHDVTLLLRWDGGTLESELSPQIKRVYLKKMHHAESGVGKAICFGLETAISFVRAWILEKDYYDICISGLFGYDPHLVFAHIHAKQYYQLLRNDVSKTVDYGRTREYMDCYGHRFDAYIGVSEYTTESFRKLYPQFADRAHTIYNVLADCPSDNTCDPFATYEGKMKILTVCRLADKAKGLYRMVQVCRELKKVFGDSFVWFIVGDGPDREEFKRKISSAGLQDQMVLCGEQSNPFPYYAHADLVAVLSYYEGLCGVVNEAKIMERPLIATEFSGIHEQILNGVNGIIVENDTSAIVNGMKNLIANPADMAKLATNGMPIELTDNDKKIKQYETLFRQIETRGENG